MDNNNKTLCGLDHQIHQKLGRFDVGLKFQLKMFKFLDSMNQKLKHGKNKRAGQDKIMELLMMQGDRPSSQQRSWPK